MSNANWSNESQAHTRICVLESQNEVKGNRIGVLELENQQLKEEVDRLQTLVNTLTTKKDTMAILDHLDKFK